MFLSEGWEDRVSDKQITLQSGFLSKIMPGDCILADRGFLTERDLNMKGAHLSMPKVRKGRDQLSGKDVHESRHNANARIHVERVIGQLKKFRILQTAIPITQVDLIDSILITVSSIVNLNKSIIPKLTTKFITPLQGVSQIMEVSDIREKFGKCVALQNIRKQSGNLANARLNQGNIRENVFLYFLNHSISIT